MIVVENAVVLSVKVLTTLVVETTVLVKLAGPPKNDEQNADAVAHWRSFVTFVGKAKQGCAGEKACTPHAARHASARNWL